MKHTTRRMVRMADANGRRQYRNAGAAEVTRRVNAGHIHLESVEGDEEANTVTYWYERGQKELCLECGPR